MQTLTPVDRDHRLVEGPGGPGPLPDEVVVLATPMNSASAAKIERRPLKTLAAGDLEIRPMSTVEKQGRAVFPALVHEARQVRSSLVDIGQR